MLSWEHGIIANSRAADGRTARRLLDVYQTATRRHLPIVVTDDLSEVPGALIELVHNRGVKRLAIFGGDGTLHKVTTILIKAYESGHIDRIPQLCSLGGGTMVAVHRGWLNWREKPKTILMKLLAAGADVPVRRFRPIRFSFVSPSGDPEVTYGYMCVLGPIAEIIRIYDQQGRSVSNGVRNFALGAMAALTGWPKEYQEVLNRFSLTVHADGQSLSMRQALTVICSVSENLILGIKPFGGQATSDQFYTLAYDVQPWQAAALVPWAYRGAYIPRGVGFFNRPVSSLYVTSVLEMFMLDGDFFKYRSDSPLVIESGPELEIVEAF